MWFIFPQILGLGFSPMSEKYAIHSLAEARAYLAHPILAGRLLDCVGLVVESEKPIQRIFGYPDWLKFRSSVTLFSAAAPNETILTQAIERCCASVRDAATLEILSGKDQTPHPAPPRSA